MNVDITFPYYSGNIHLSKAIGVVNLAKFISSHKNPHPNTIAILEKVAKASVDGNMKLKRELKHGLYAFTPSIMINAGFARSYANVMWWTGLMQLDFDGIPSAEMAKEMKQHLFDNNNEIVCAYLSPSGRGVKCLIKTTIPESKEQYKALHKAIETEFSAYDYFDPATKNAMLPLFLSADTEILSRDESECPPWIEEDWSVTNYVRLNDTPNFNSVNSIELTNKTIRILNSKILNINNNGHPQVRSASLILGSRVTAGYISKADAELNIIRLINSNLYLQKGVEGYIATAMWGIKEGMKHPKYY
jgi:hypothetical protein